MKTNGFLRDPSFFHRWLNHEYRRVLHIDTEHTTKDGFWFATAGQYDGRARAMSWNYQPFEVECRANHRLAFNPWINTYSCLADFEAMEAADPEGRHAEATRQCRTENALPYSGGVFTLAQVEPPLRSRQCANYFLPNGRYSMRFAGVQEHRCAPWEDQTPTADGLPKCAFTEYPWIKDPDPLPWLPAPDACTRLPENANAPGVTYDFDAAKYNEPNPACDGSASAPNCTAATASHPACGGPSAFPTFDGFNFDENYVDPTPQYPDPQDPTDPEDPVDPEEPTDPGTPQFTESFTATATSVAGSSTISSTQTQRSKAPNGVQTQKYSKRYGGKMFKATKSAPVYHEASVTLTREATVAWTSHTASVTWSCERQTRAEATACAKAEAEKRAQKAANDAAANEAKAEARPLAQAAAKADALAEADTLARTGQPTAAEIALARDKALALAKRAVEAAIKKYKQR